MNINVLTKAAEYNRYSRDNIITNITERFQYDSNAGIFESYITVVIKDNNGFFKTFRFATDRAVDNAFTELIMNGNSNLKRLLKFTR